MSDNTIGTAKVALVAEGDQFDASMDKSARKVESFSLSTTQSSQKAVTALNTVGDAAGDSAQKMSNAQVRFIESLQRQVAATEGGKIAAIELKAAQLGVADAAAPMIARYRELEAAQRANIAASADSVTVMRSVAESDADATSRIKSLVAASLELTAVRNKEIETSLLASRAAREAGANTPAAGPSVSFAAQNRSLQETADLANEVNRALASIGRGASSNKDLQTQTDKLVSLWGQGRISAEQYAVALKNLDASEATLAKSSAQASAKADEFIAKLKDQAATANLTKQQLLEYRAAQLGVVGDAAPFIQKIADGEKAMHGFSLETGSARRELAVIGRELARGDLGAAGRSFSIFAERSGLMTTLMSPAVLIIGALVAGLVALGAATYQGHAEQTQFNNALIITNNVAGTTAEGLHSLSVEAAATGGSLSIAKDAVLQLASSGKFTGDQIRLIATSATEMQEATGKAVDATVKEFEELAKKPAEASAKLNEQYHYLTQSVYDQITALERQGDAQGAADLAERTYASAMRDRTVEINSNIGSIERAWRSAKSAAVSFWDSAMNLGRSDQFKSDIAEWTRRLNMPGNTPEQAAEMKAVIADLQKKDAAADFAAKQKEEESRSVEASLEASRAIDTQTESIDKNIKKRNELLKLSERFSKMEAEAQRTGKRNERLDNVDFGADGKPAGGGLFGTLQKDIEHKYKEQAPKGSDNALNMQLRQLQGQYQEQERALKLSNLNIKNQYDIGLLDTRQFLAAEYEAKKTALGKEMEIAQQQEVLARGKKNGTALEDAKNLQKRIRDEQLANEEKYNADVASAMAKSQRDVSAYIESLNDAYDTRQQAISNLVSGAGLGNAAKDELNRMNQVQQEFDKKSDALRKSLAKGSAHGGINQDEYDQELQSLQDSLKQRLDLERKYTEDLKATQEDGWAGATRFMQNYADSAANVAGQVESAFQSAARGMEDAIVKFATTGKLSFGDLAMSVIADIIRMQARAAVSGLFNLGIQSLGGLFGGTAGTTSAGGIDAGARGSFAKGGAFDAGVQMFAAGGAFTNGVVSSPTLAPMALFGEAGPEAIMPLTRGSDGSLGVQVTGGGGSSVSVVQHINIDSRADQATILQAMEQAKQAAKTEIQQDIQRGSRKYQRA